MPPSIKENIISHRIVKSAKVSYQVGNVLLLTVKKFDHVLIIGLSLSLKTAKILTNLGS